MGTNPMRFRVEHNKAKTSFWYTLVAGNGNTVMTSKTNYDDHDNALRAARRQAEAVREAALIVEYERDGELVEEEVAASADVGEMADLPRGYTRTKREPIAVPETSDAVALARLNPNS